jgi:hypothetical protein
MMLDVSVVIDSCIFWRGSFIEMGNFACDSSIKYVPFSADCTLTFVKRGDCSHVQGVMAYCWLSNCVTKSNVYNWNRMFVQELSSRKWPSDIPGRDVTSCHVILWGSLICSNIVGKACVFIVLNFVHRLNVIKLQRIGRLTSSGKNLGFEASWNRGSNRYLRFCVPFLSLDESGIQLP